MKLTPITFIEAVVAVVTLVWVVNFIADLVDPTYDGSPYNSIFMVVVGSGGLVSVVSQTVRKASESANDKQG